MKLFQLTIWTFALAFCIGCGSGHEYASPSASVNSSAHTMADPEEAYMEMDAVVLTAEADEQGGNDGTLSAVASAIANRKIIYNSTIGLVVEDYKKFETDLPKLVATHGGFVANSNTNRRYADNQSGTWVIRVPIDRYSAFLSGVDALGFAESRSEDAQDVTEEYVDVEARIKNKRQLETRILKMLEERTGKLSDVLDIERELSRVREEIERMEGRLRFLKDRTSLATITINCREQKEYQPVAAPTLRSRIRLAWTDSIGSLRFTGENVLVAAIALLPWLLVLSVIGFIALKLFRRWRRGSIKSIAKES